MSENLKLGEIITSPQSRDCVHIAVAPVVAGNDLAPGAHVGLKPDGTADWFDTVHIGIVDPFLKTVVHKGARFWLFMYPGSITSIRHLWTHPAFKTKAPEGQS